MAKRKLPLPCSFLVTTQGEMAAIYRGPVTLERLRQDVVGLKATEDERMAASLVHEGRWEFAPKGLRALVYLALAQQAMEPGGDGSETADVALTKAIAAQPDAVAPRLLRARMLRRTRRYDESIKEYAALFDIHPELVDERIEYGEMLAMVERWEDAKSQYERVIAGNANSAKAHHGLGKMAKQQGHLAKAESELKKAVELDPTYTEYQADLGGFLFDQRRLADARPLLIKVADANLDSEVATRLSWILAVIDIDSLRDGEKAKSLAQFATRKTGYNSPLAFRSLSAAYAELDEYNTALVATTKAIELARSQGNNRLVEELESQAVLYVKRKKIRVPAAPAPAVP
jgi:tetratricopeptide (TPR) repeat protein